MGRRNGDDSDATLFLLIVVALAVCFGIWKFSTALHVDFASGAKCIGVLVLVTGLLVTYSKLGFELNRWVWSFSVSLYTLAFIPILDKWAADAVPNFMQNSTPTPIYGDWYFQAGLFFMPLLICWAYTKLFDE